MKSFNADANHVHKSIVIFTIIALIMLVLGFALDTGIALRRRTSDITLEDFLILLGALSMMPVLFSLLRLSPERCALEIDGQNITYRNTGFGWPLTKSYSFSSSEIVTVSQDGGAVQINFVGDSQYSNEDRKEGEADLEIDAPLFGLSADALEKLLTGR